MGAVIGVEGNDTHVETNENGQFAIAGKVGDVLIVLNPTTLNEKRFPVKKLNMGTLKMNQKEINLDVVVGYGTQKKVNLTGSVSALNFKDVATMPVANTASMLQGRLPGVTLTANGAQAGKDNPEIRIRGVGTFGNNNPMVLIDGVESSVSQIADIPAKTFRC
ncbi:Plug domain-containing protein [Ornithobacterium rhinotracheale]|uniref:TonB-dependent receptor plug domain-containing protein n=1 Tax=Ornithobacterium rhinotracheale TaxID=28251 RepID=UPI001C883BC3|nr:TonB-dependent receptor plug domain-containing protein [Ornithobacterium rhinotracheale]UOH78138.1 Plug domain-containing protein [Ornithobacterium rhinotracheale]